MIRQHLKTVLCSYSEICFLNHWGIGLVLFALTLVNPNVCVNGLVAVLAAYVAAQFLGLDKAFLASGFYTYNPLMVGLSMGYLFRISPLTCLIVALAGILTFVVTHMMHSISSYYLRLPILSLPFVLISSLAYLASARYSNLLVNGLYEHAFGNLELYLPVWFSGLLKSLGAIFFMPRVEVGLAMLVLFFLCSRILFFLAIVGYYSGSLVTALLIGSFHQAFTNANHFNFIWIAMALGGIFLIPSLKSYVIAVVAVATSTLLLHAMEVFWASYGIPGFALPFNLVTLAFLYVLGVTGFPLISQVIKATPEATLDHYLTVTRRFKGTWRTLSLPFAGAWTVWQGPNGQWTHQGAWQHAFDFVITDEQGHTFKDEGHNLTDYYAFGKPILAPIRGRITGVTNTLTDNPPGHADKANNWGNLVVIQDPRGFWVELSHFKKGSIVVAEGQWVEKGALLGHCGNSGYSPQPHIHLHVQATETVGSATLPFSLVGFTSDGQYFANDLPAEGAVVEAIVPNKTLTRQLTFLLDQTLNFDVFRSGQLLDTVTWTVKMAWDGTFYFDSGKGRLYFGIHECTFYLYHTEGYDRYLNLLQLALPRLPLYYAPSLRWEDHAPSSALQRGFKQTAILFFSAFYHKLNCISVTCAWSAPQQICGTVTASCLGAPMCTQVELDPENGFKHLVLDDWEFKRSAPQEVNS
ncbi:MAG: urea transporter [Phycisphaeraceae bacterium]|nr:urea transporter [Phycisphaeraceae bacterium]